MISKILEMMSHWPASGQGIFILILVLMILLFIEVMVRHFIVLVGGIDVWKLDKKEEKETKSDNNTVGFKNEE